MRHVRSMIFGPNNRAVMTQTLKIIIIGGSGQGRLPLRIFINFIRQERTRCVLFKMLTCVWIKVGLKRSLERQPQLSRKTQRQLFIPISWQILIARPYLRWIEHLPSKQNVTGSNPVGLTNFTALQLSLVQLTTDNRATLVQIQLGLPISNEQRG